MAYTTINDPSAQFQTQIYTGNSSTQSVTNSGNSNLQPDWVWTKCRSNTSNHFLFDSTRGVQNQLHSDTNDPQGANATSLTSFNTDGWTMGNTGGMNFNSQTYVGWQWKATGGTTATNNAGSISSTVQANTTAGFSVVKWTSDGNNGRTVGHGLGVKPTVIITKNISAVGSWYSFFEAAGVDKYLRINSEDAVTTNTDIFGGGAQATSVFTIGQSSAGYSNGNDIIAYVFAPIQGYSKFGKYIGNNNNDGPFVYTGFKPAWIMIKNSSASSQWVIIDATRDPFNVTDARLRANTTAAEATETFFDFLSNGFKVRATGTDKNDSGNVYIYMAFAENPLVASNDVIALAR